MFSFDLFYLSVYRFLSFVLSHSALCCSNCLFPVHSVQFISFSVFLSSQFRIRTNSNSTFVELICLFRIWRVQNSDTSQPHCSMWSDRNKLSEWVQLVYIRNDVCQKQQYKRAFVLMSKWYFGRVCVCLCDSLVCSHFARHACQYTVSHVRTNTDARLCRRTYTHTVSYAWVSAWVYECAVGAAYDTCMGRRVSWACWHGKHIVWCSYHVYTESIGSYNVCWQTEQLCEDGSATIVSTIVLCLSLSRSIHSV